MMNTEPKKRITITQLGTQLSQNADELLVQNLNGIKYRDAYAIKMPQGECWLFDYGILVAWDVSEDDRKQLISSLQPVIESPLSAPSIEQYTWRISDKETTSIHLDEVELANDESLTRLSLSHAFAQSAKLAFFEEKTQQLIQDNDHLARQLAITGKAPFSRTGLAKLRGQFFQTSSDIALNFALLDTPEFFWDYPELEDNYHKLSKYLDITPRIDILNKKLATIQSLLDMLTAQQYQKHSAFLEWVIIILIAVDILIYFVKP